MFVKILSNKSVSPYGYVYVQPSIPCSLQVVRLMYPLMYQNNVDNNKLMLYFVSV